MYTFGILTASKPVLEKSTLSFPFVVAKSTFPMTPTPFKPDSDADVEKPALRCAKGAGEATSPPVKPDLDIPICGGPAFSAVNLGAKGPLPDSESLFIKRFAGISFSALYRVE